MEGAGRLNDLLEDLTGPQREAVLHPGGPLLVLAAAGSGKTRVITRRIAALVANGVRPWQILALTFTNKAAGEMRERVHSLLGDDPRAVSGLTVTTFHALCARLLRRFHAAAGLPADYTIYDGADQVALMKRTIEQLEMSVANWPPRSVLSRISQAKNDLIDEAEFAASARDFYDKTVAKVYKAYQSQLAAANAVDFDDLLLRTAAMLREKAEVRGQCQGRWRHLLVDEYQDTNRAQFVIASQIAGEGGPGAEPNICVVGDPDQSIYGWRGADITNILEFEEHYPTARVIALGENFRSTAPILAVADSLIRHNRRRKHKDLFTRRSGGEKVRVVRCRDEQHEAKLVVDWLKRLHDEGHEGVGTVAWREMAVFYRTNALSRVVEDVLRRAAVPYQIARGHAFYEREEVKNALAYLRVVANENDTVSLTRIVNTPTRGLGDAAIERLEAFAASRSMPLMEALRCADEVDGLSARALGGARRMVQLVDEWTEGGTFMGTAVGGSLANLVSRVLRESGLEQMYRDQAAKSKSEADEERLENLDELVSSAREFELKYDPAADPAAISGEADAADGFAVGDEGPSLQLPPLLGLLRAYLESVALVADADAVDPAQGAVTLMTLHAAKGLEFTAVAMIGLEEGLLPHSRAAESPAALEEERRLCFVGITRAMRLLTLTCAGCRVHRGMPMRSVPSRFLEEFDREQVIDSDQSSPFAGLEEEWGGDEAPAARREEHPEFPVGAVVRHPQFGVGRVKSVSRERQARAVVDFQAVGRKTLVLEFARLTRIS